MYNIKIVLISIGAIICLIAVFAWIYWKILPSSIGKHEMICKNYNDDLGTIVNIKNDTDKSVNAYLDKYKPPCLPIDDGKKYTCNPPKGDLTCGTGPYHKIKGYPNATKECTWANNDACMTIVSADGKTERLAKFDKTYNIELDDKKDYLHYQNWQKLEPGETWKIRVPLSNKNHPYWCNDTSIPDVVNSKMVNNRSCSGIGGWFTSDNVFLTEPKGTQRHEWNINALDNDDIVKSPFTPRKVEHPDDLKPGQIYYNLSAVDGFNANMDIEYTNAIGCYDNNFNKNLNTQIDSCNTTKIKDCPKAHQALIWLNEQVNGKSNAIYTCLSPCGIQGFNGDSGIYIDTSTDSNLYRQKIIDDGDLVCASSADPDVKKTYHKSWDSLIKTGSGYKENIEQATWAEKWLNYLRPGINTYGTSGDKKQITKDACGTYGWAYDEQIMNESDEFTDNPLKPLKVCDWAPGHTLNINATTVLGGQLTGGTPVIVDSPFI